MNNLIKLVGYLLCPFGLGTDVVTVTTGTAGDAGSAAAEQINFMAAKMIDVAELVCILKQFGEQVSLPSNSSKTAQFTRMEKLTVAATPGQLTEGISPSVDPLTINSFTAVTEQYAKVVGLTDLAELTSRHPLVQKAIYTLGLHAGEVYDTVLFNILDAASNSYRPNGRAGDTSLLAADLIGYNDLIANQAILSDAGGNKFPDGAYVFVTPPQVAAGIKRDPDWKASNQYQAPSKIWRGEIGELGGFRVVESNSPAFTYTSQATSGKADKVFSSFALGMNAFQVVDLQNLKMYIQAPGGHTDPVEQRRLIGYKYAAKSVITVQAWIRRVRSAGANSVTN